MENGRDTHKFKQFRLTPIIELIIIIFLGNIVFALSARYDALEHFLELSKRYEKWNLDEILLLSFYFSIAMFIFALRRWREKRKNLEALHKNEERFSIAMEAARDGLWEWNITTGDTYFSPAFFRMLGYELEKTAGAIQDWIDLVHPDDREHALLANRECIENRRESFQVEFRMKAQNGDWRWILGRGKAVKRANDGKALLMVGTHVDITEQKRIEEELCESRGKYQAIIEAFDGLIYVCSSDFKIEYMNRALIERTGYNAVGKLCYEILHDRDSVCPWCVNDEVLAGRTVRWELQSPKDRRWYYVVNVPVYRHDGSILKQAMIMDITDRKQAEESLRENRELLRVVVEGTSDAVFVKDLAGRYRLLNGAASRLVGKSPDEVIGRDDTYIFPAEEARTMMEGDRSVMDAGATSTYEEYLTSATGEHLVFLSTKGPLFDEQGNVTGLFGISRDITTIKRAETERLELERKLQHSQKLESLGVLAGGIAHDFNNILTIILGNLELAGLKISVDTPVLEKIELAIKACNRAADLIRMMLAYTGKGVSAPAKIRLNEVICENEPFILAYVHRKVEFNISLGPDIPLIEADKSQILQIIINLVINASEAIGDGTGAITLCTGIKDCDDNDLAASRVEEKPPAGRFAYLEVSDSGCGMDDETLQRVFEPFFTTKFLGRGLGLSAVQGIVRTHNGAILLESVPGLGSRFCVLLPIYENDIVNKPEFILPASQSELTTAAHRKVLVVDDEEQVRDMCIAFLEHLGFHSVSAANGHEALDIFSKNADEIGLIILDLTMPVMDGARVFHELKRIRQDVAVILSSGYSEEKVLERFADDKPEGFVQKPFQMTELKEKIEQVIR